jgi:hypothetical protein
LASKAVGVEQKTVGDASGVNYWLAISTHGEPPSAQAIAALSDAKGAFGLSGNPRHRGGSTY